MIVFNICLFLLSINSSYIATHKLIIQHQRSKLGFNLSNNRKYLLSIISHSEFSSTYFRLFSPICVQSSLFESINQDTPQTQHNLSHISCHCLICSGASLVIGGWRQNILNLFGKCGHHLWIFIALGAHIFLKYTYLKEWELRLFGNDFIITRLL